MYNSLPLARPLRLLLLGVAMGLASCSASRVSMQVPASLGTASALPVTGRQGFGRSYQFGEFGTTQVRQGWLSTSSWGVGSWLAPVWYEQGRARQKSSFTMQPVAGTAWQAQCAYYARSSDLRVATGPASHAAVGLDNEELFSSIIQAPNQRTWQLVLECQNQIGSRPQFARGTFSNGDSTLQVRPIAQLLRRDGKPMTLPFGAPIGYEFARPNGSVVAAVELMGRGRVWVAPTLPPEVKGPVAAAVTAMLMRQQAM